MAKVKHYQGVKEFVDPETGEVLQFRIVGTPAGFKDENFVKFFDAFTIDLLEDEELMGKSIRLLFWIIKHLKMNSIEFPLSYNLVKDDLKIHRDTFYRWRKTLEEKGIIQRIDVNYYRLNPMCVVKGEGKKLVDEWLKNQNEEKL